MSNKQIGSLLILSIFSFFHVAFSQDIIIKKNNEQIKAKVLEIGTTEIKFRYFDAPDGPIITIKKSEIKTIKIKGTTGDNTMDIAEDPMSISHNSIMDKNSVLKFNFFSPLKHHLAFTYEWMNKPGFNWEFGLGIIGPGVGIFDIYLNTKPKGFFLRTGPKFLLGHSSDYAIEGIKYAHPLKGRYIKIETIISSFSKTYDKDTSSYYYFPYSSSTIRVKDTYQSIAFNLIYGRQFIIGNTLTLGYYVGVGYGFESKSSSYTSNSMYYYDYNPPGRYSHTYFGKDFPLTLTAGFTIGYILKAPDWLSGNVSKQRNVKPSRHSMGN